MTFGDTVNGWMLALGGPAVVIACASVWSSYNNWRSRRAMEEIRDMVRDALTINVTGKTVRIATPAEAAQELSAYGREFSKEWQRIWRVPQ